MAAPKGNVGLSENEMTTHKTSVKNGLSSSNELPENIWMLKPCELYKEEYEECCGYRGRFQQYYIYGAQLDCKQWKEDYENCIKFRNTGSVEAAEAVIESEKVRREQRLAGARNNDVWEYRHKPPNDWSSPVSTADSFLAQAQKLREEDPEKAKNLGRCIIS